MRVNVEIYKYINKAGSVKAVRLERKEQKRDGEVSRFWEEGEIFLSPPG